MLHHGLACEVEVEVEDEDEDEDQGVACQRRSASLSWR